MRRFLLFPVVFAMLFAASCSKDSSVEDATLQRVKLPGGKVVRCEVMLRPEDMARGMLFLHAQPGNYKYWMYQVKIPLDILWMNAEHRIVEMSLNTPPCPSKSARECPNYGGNQTAQVVLELAGGEAVKQGLKVGDVLEF